jgi:undecaprenyl pyrophosphate phosphatase UppP
MRFLVNYLRTHPINVFAYYRWGLAAIIAIVALIRV